MATGEGAPALLLDNVVKTYGAVRAVEGVSFSRRLASSSRCSVPTVPASPRCSTAVRPVRAGFRPHRDHGTRHAARSGAGIGEARHRLSAALGYIEYNGKLEIRNSLLNVVLYDKLPHPSRSSASQNRDEY
jgi:hypothetical protein